MTLHPCSPESAIPGCESFVTTGLSACQEHETAVVQTHVANGWRSWTTTICGRQTSWCDKCGRRPTPVASGPTPAQSTSRAAELSTVGHRSRLKTSSRRCIEYNAIPGGGSNVVMRRSTWRRVGPFEPRFRKGGEDWEMSIRLAKIAGPAWVCSPLVGKRVHASNMSLDTEEIVRATRLVESLHGTTADWGRVHRWLAERYLRSGNRRAASVQFARAAVHGQLPGVISDLGAIARRRLGRNRPTERRPAVRGNAWTAAALEWLREFGIGV